MDTDIDDDGLPPARHCPECNAVLEPEPIATATRVVIVWTCSTHGALGLADPFADV